MTTLQEEIEQLARLEQRYNTLLEKLLEHPQANFGLIQLMERRLSQVSIKRLELESKALKD